MAKILTPVLKTYIYIHIQMIMKLKNFLALITFLTSPIWLSAQIIVTNATFPDAGDTLKTATDLSPEGIVITASGGPQVWDFSSLTPSTRTETVFRLAVEGSAHANFPGADLVTISDVGAEVYYSKSNSIFAILGITGEGLGGGFPVEADFKYNPPYVERKAPLTFFDVDNFTSNATVSLPTSTIPSEIFDSLGIPTGLFDSIRIRLDFHRILVAEGYGSVTIPGGTYEVLRQKETVITSTGIDVHTLLGWIDIGVLLGGAFEFPTDTTITFNFLSNTEKEPIAVVTVDSTGFNAVQVEYKDNGIPSAINPVTGETISVTVSPNPFVDHVTFELKNAVPGNYSLRLYDLNGKQIFTKPFSSNQEMISLGSYSEGMYLYNVVDTNGQVLGIGKLLKAR